MYCRLCKERVTKKTYQCDYCDREFCETCAHDCKYECEICKRGLLK